jgi:hypothetical protein
MALTKGQALEMLDRLVDPRGFQPERVAQDELNLRSLAYYVGKHHFQQIGSNLYELPLENDNEVRYRSNLIVSAVERAVSKVGNLNGKFRVAPKSGTPESRHAAKISDRVLSHIFDITDYEAQKHIVTKWAAICGSGFCKVAWDPTAGDATRFYIGADGRAIATLNNEEKAVFEREGRFKDLPLGDLKVTPVSPFSFHWDWDSRGGIEECDWCAEVFYLSLPAIAEMFDVSEQSVPESKVPDGAIVYEEALAFMTSGSGYVSYGYQPKQKEREGRGIVTVFYRRASKKYPKGQHVIRVGNQIIRNDTNPHRATGFDLPYVKLDWWKVPGRFSGLGLVEQLMSSQFRYNEARAKMTEFQNVFGTPPIFVPDGSGIPTDQYVLQPGMVYSYNPVAGKIEFAQPPQLPAEVAGNAIACRDEINWISSQSDPDLSGAPGQMRSGEALRMFFDEKNRVLSTTQKMSLKFDQRVAQQALALAKINYEEERTLVYAGEDGDFSVVSFRGVDLHNDVRITGEPSDPDSIMAWKAEVRELLEVGALDPLNNKQHWRLLVNAYRYNTFDEASQDWARDQANQERETRVMLADPVRFQNQPYPVADFEDHEAHVTALERFMKTDEFRALDPISQGVLATHRALHVQEIQKAVEAQLAMAEAVKGTPGEKGKASQPKRSSA